MRQHTHPRGLTFPSPGKALPHTGHQCVALSPGVFERAQGLGNQRWREDGRVSGAVGSEVCCCRPLVFIHLDIGRPTLVIPWVVMQELDALKSSNKFVGSKAHKAINFLHGCFSSHHPRVRGQSMLEVGVSVPVQARFDCLHR